MHEKGIDPYEINFEGTELEKKVAVKGTSEALVREFMENCLVDQSGNLPAKSIVFAISKKHAKRLWEAFEKLYPENKGRLARVIASEDPRAQASIKEFKTESLPEDSVSVRENIRDVEKAMSPKLWDNVGLDPVEFLKKKITPLMRFKQDVNLNEASFTLKCEKLGIAVLQGDREEILRLKPKIAFKEKVLSSRFWEGVSFEDSQMLISELAILMKYMAPEPRKTIVIDMDDMIQQRKLIEFGPDAKQEYVKVYKEKVEDWIKRLADGHPAIIKIKKDEVLTEADLRTLEETLNNPELYITEDVLQKVYNRSKGTLVQFVKNILGLYKFPDPATRIRDAFNTYIIENNRHYSSDQLNFIRTVQTVFAKKKHIEYVELFDAPFTNFGINAPMPMFTENELNDFINICSSLEKEVYVEA